MLIDASTLDNDTEIEASVCIVGSGPAGLTLAIELLQAGVSAVVLESGGTGIEAWAQELNDGPVVGDAYSGLRNTRQRQLGGTIQAWNTPVGDDIGAKYAPLDPHDFDTREAGEPKGWPIPYGELIPFYRRAQSLCGLGGFDYSAAPMLQSGRRPFQLGGDRLVSKVYQFGRADQFLYTHVDAVREAIDVHLYLNLTAVALEAGTGRSGVTGLRAVNRRGKAVTVRADFFVLAGGAVENARLLLLLQVAHPGVIEDPGDWLGRCFMEHPRDNGLVLVPRSSETFHAARFYDVCDLPDGSTVCGRLAFADGPPAGSGLPNMSVTLLPRARRETSWIRRMIGRRTGTTIGGYNWSSIEHPEQRIDAFRLLVNMEQRPRRENRIVLSSKRDALGQPRAALHWRLRPEELDSVQKLRRLLAHELETCGIGRVEIDETRRPDPNAHHHAGTTRMAASPKDGVVSPNCHVFGVENLYVAGASVFPTAGFANPTLTIVAMASRLASHLRTRVRPPREGPSRKLGSR